MLSANDIKIIQEQAYAGVPSKLKDVCDVYPGMMYDMIKMGSLVYSTRLGMLLMTKEDIRKVVEKKELDYDLVKDLSPLAYLLKSAQLNDIFLLELQDAFSTFIKEEILLLPKLNAVLVGPMTEKRLITEDNFSDFQQILSIQNRREVPKPPPENESAIARKMRLAAEKRDEIKRKQQQKNGEQRDLAELLEIAEVFGIDYKEKSIYAFYGLLQRHQLREKWNQDIQMLCAGADPKKTKAKYWGENPDN